MLVFIDLNLIELFHKVMSILLFHASEPNFKVVQLYTVQLVSSTLMQQRHVYIII